MRALVLSEPGGGLEEREVPVPEPGPGEVLLRVQACGVCRTDLHVLDGELTQPKLPLILGHQIVGEVVGGSRGRFGEGERVGVPWLGWACGKCRWCASGRENLCPRARFTGYDIDGGYAEFAVTDERFCMALPAEDDAAELAPLLCGGLIGYRALRMCGDAERVGFYGFGSSAHMIAQVALHQGREVFAFVRPGDEDAAEFARNLGVTWAGFSSEEPPEPLGAAIIFAPAGELVPAALRVVEPGGTVVCAGIHMSDIPSFPYADLWMERSIRSVANLTRRDGEEFLALAPQAGVRTTVTRYPLADAQTALDDLRAGRVNGSAVLVT